MTGTKGNGDGHRWIVSHCEYPHDWCLIWPFFRDAFNGYGYMGHDGKAWRAHRYMCTVAHGEPPAPEYEASHSCGRGHEGCVNPRHLSWKTRSDNRRDSISHGTSVRNRDNRRLTPEQVEQIRALRGLKTTTEIGDMFGVTPSAISHIMTGHTHSRPSKINHFTAAEDEAIRQFGTQGLTYNQMAKKLGRGNASVGRRAKSLGVASSYEPPKPGPNSKFYPRNTSSN